MAFGMAEELSREDQRFLKERAPRLLQVIEEAKERNFDEVVEEAMERVGELQEEWREARLLCETARQLGRYARRKF